jgi:hypothetical protein
MQAGNNARPSQRRTIMPRTKGSKNSTPPALDFGSLTVQDAAVPQRASTKDPESNPMLPHLRASLENNYSGKAVTVPEANATQVVNMIRNAANHLGCGSRTAVEDAGKGNVTVRFAAKTRRARKATDTADAPTA